MYVHSRDECCLWYVYFYVFIAYNIIIQFIYCNTFFHKNLIDKVSEISTDDSSLGNRILGQYWVMLSRENFFFFRLYQIRGQSRNWVFGVFDDYNKERFDLNLVAQSRLLWWIDQVNDGSSTIDIASSKGILFSHLTGCCLII
jgi:hypothetical protein